MFKTLPILLLVAAAHCQNNENPDTPTAAVADSDDVKSKDLSCTLPDGQKGKCVAYYLCNDGGIDTGVGDDLCVSYLDKCCLVSDKTPSVQPLKPRPQREALKLARIHPRTARAADSEGCGWANPNGVDFVKDPQTNGFTKFGEFPWMVAVLWRELVNENQPEGEMLNLYVGGGSLIHPSVVLTAANNVVTAKALRVRAGEWDTQSTKEIYPFQDRDVSSVEIHKDFHKGNLFYDIAVLFLAKPMNLAPNVGVACLPPARQPQEDGIRCFATGWGKNKFDKEGRYQSLLKKIELPVVKHEKCQAALRKTVKDFQLHSSFMCAGGEPGKATCTGDGGSPLSCPIEHVKNRYVQSGIVSWSIDCGKDDTPGVYVDVSVMRDWIDEKVAGKGYDPNIYTF